MAQDARNAMLLILAQVDDASGEVLQDVMERLHRAGSRSVQLLASLAKKGRPGHVLLIDVPAAREDDVALVLGTELGVWGYRVVESSHRHFDIHLLNKPLRVRVAEEVLVFEVGWKRIEKEGCLLAVKIEHDHLASLRDELERKGARVSLRSLRANLEQQLLRDPNAPSLELTF